jgi:hypothetical protein
MSGKRQKTQQQKKQRKSRTNNEITELRLTHWKIDISKLKVFFEWQTNLFKPPKIKQKAHQSWTTKFDRNK